MLLQLSFLEIVKVSYVHTIYLRELRDVIFSAIHCEFAAACPADVRSREDRESRELESRYRVFFMMEHVEDMAI